LNRLTKAAERLLRDARGTASPSALSQVDESLRAAAVTEEGREVLARGRFVEPLRASGFDAFAGIDVPKHAPRKKAKPAPKPKPDPRIRELEQELRETERRAERLRAELRKLRG
jgi:hypothetical protein